MSRSYSWGLELIGNSWGRKSHLLFKHDWAGGSGGGGSGNISVKDDHVDVAKHNLNQLAPSHDQRKQLLIDRLVQKGGVAIVYDGRGSGFVLTNPESKSQPRQQHGRCRHLSGS